MFPQVDLHEPEDNNVIRSVFILLLDDAV